MADGDSSYGLTKASMLSELDEFVRERGGGGNAETADGDSESVAPREAPIAAFYEPEKSSVRSLDCTPQEFAEALKRALILGKIEGRDFARLRTLLFQYSPETCESYTAEPEGGAPTTLTDSLGMTYAAVPAGGRKTKSGFSGDFYMACELVTQGGFYRFLSEGIHEYPSDVWNYLVEAQDENRPMIHLSWYDAYVFCRWLSQLHGEYYSLPHLEEWGLAGQTFAGGWDNIGTEFGGRFTGSKWRPPAINDYGKFSGDDGFGPGFSGLLWEWCLDSASLHGDARIACAGVWANSAAGHKGTRTRSCPVLVDQRLASAGIRPAYLPGHMLWRNNRALIAESRTDSPVESYLKLVVHNNDIPGSPARADERPDFYHSLPPYLKRRIDTVLLLLQRMESFRPPGSTAGRRQVDILSGTQTLSRMSITKIRPVRERELSRSCSISEAPDNTEIIPVKAVEAILAPKEEDTLSTISRVLKRLRRETGL